MQLASIQSLSPEDIIFKEAKDSKVKDTNIKYKRIPIEVKYPDGTKGPLVIETPFLFSFGINEKKDQNTNKLVGYSLPVCLWEKDSSPNLQQEQFYSFICQLTEISKRYLRRNMAQMLHHLSLNLFITNRLNTPTKKERKKQKEIKLLLPYFMRKFNTRIN